MVLNDATLILNERDINLAAPSQMLTLLQTTRQPFFIFFIATNDQTGDQWITDSGNALIKLYNLFENDPKRHNLAIVQVGSKQDWQNNDHPVKKKWKITQIPTILRFELVTVSGEAFYHTRKLIGLECLDENMLVLIRDGPMEGIPSDWDRWRAKFYQKETDLDADVWEYEFDAEKAENSKSGSKGKDKPDKTTKEAKALTAPVTASSTLNRIQSLSSSSDESNIFLGLI
ncbi:hypothetical protein Dda_6407 [Drechslerella dactyloides]|uniref:Thioredoxin domain-containing protein n=1 Tax=Drechslerella dactyloides TaxID=74499 RepID=A0AAD6NHH8_DREDA|nr:hypothetical protein Dda_6407 [Drechslerella dactyloides]